MMMKTDSDHLAFDEGLLKGFDHATWAAAQNTLATFKLGSDFYAMVGYFELANVLIVVATAHFEDEQGFANCAFDLHVSQQQVRVDDKSEIAVSIRRLPQESRAFSSQKRGKPLSFKPINEAVL
jgi:hypothetical protein